MTNLTPAQLEQFESTFRYFDRDESNTLSQPEMGAALASLSIVYSVSCLSVGNAFLPGLKMHRRKIWIIYTTD